jgi:hypothetical protein
VRALVLFVACAAALAAGAPAAAESTNFETA